MADWAGFAGAVAAMEKVVTDDARITDEATRAEGLRYLTRIIAGGIPLTMEATDPDFPKLVQFLSPAIQFGLPAADCLYLWATVEGGRTYRVSGTRGSARLFDIETRENHMAQLAQWKLLDRRADFDINPDGSFEVIISADERPGNWLRLPDGPGNIVIRQYFYDWVSEEPAEIRIECLDATYPPRPRDPAAGLDMLTRWVMTIPAACRHAVEGHYTAPDEALEFVPLDFGWADLLYGKGHYRCAEDEAVIVEVTPPEAPYWGIQLVSHFWEALDWYDRQTSINGHQAHVDSDGVFRAVISHSDPGVPNWLDTAGRPEGLIAARYFRAASTPVPSLRTVPLEKLDAELPPDTPRVTPEERQASLRARAASVRRRGCD